MLLQSAIFVHFIDVMVKNLVNCCRGIAEVPETMSDNSSMDSGPIVNDPVSTPVLGMGQVTPNIYARALYTFKGKKDSYLSFTKGDLITINEQQEQWSHGELNGKQGWLPNSYVRVEEAQAATAGGVLPENHFFGFSNFLIFM